MATHSTTFLSTACSRKDELILVTHLRAGGLRVSHTNGKQPGYQRITGEGFRDRDNAELRENRTITP
jgi:hypothetical protein